MKSTVSTITIKGQVTIPVGIRKALGLKPGDRVTFVLQGGEAKIMPAKSSLEAGFGAVSPKRRPEDLELLCQQATEEAALKRWDKVQRASRKR